MAVKYIVVSKKNPQKPNETPKFYAQAVAGGVEDFDGMTRAVADRCTVTGSDAKAVLDAFQTIMIQRLQSGQIVRLNDLGSFRMSLSSEGVATEKDFNAAKITKSRIIFVPSPALKNMCKAITYSKTTAEPPTKPGGGDGGSGGDGGDVVDPSA